MSDPGSDRYQTVARAVRVRIPVGQCRFFASVKEATTEAEAKAFIESIATDFADATHNAWGYKLGAVGEPLCRSSDAGEPVNTAGPPILQAIEGRGLTNVVVVVTRFFGGVKLGVGGLIRAYREAAAAGLEEAGVREEIITRPIRVKNVDYACLGEVLRELESLRCTGIALDYGEQVTLRAEIQPQFFTEGLAARIADITKGQGVVESEPGPDS